ncbi:hypothetical protein THAOC_07019, partial [Thalassiosira oceanica]
MMIRQGQLPDKQTRQPTRHPGRAELQEARRRPRPKSMHKKLSGDGTNGQVGPFETALGEFYTGNVLPVAVGAFSEVNEDASKLITRLARLTAKTDFGKSMSPLVSNT